MFDSPTVRTVSRGREATLANLKKPTDAYYTRALANQLI